MLPGVDESWDRIVNWLERHAPRLAATINPPATDLALARAETAVQAPLPVDLVTVERTPECRRTRLNGGEETELPPGRAGSPCDVWFAGVDADRRRWLWR